MTAAKKTGQAAADEPGGREAAELELARQLAERARAEGLSLTGPGGLLGRLTKVVLEGALGQDGRFHADTLLVQHNGNYFPPKPGQPPPHRADLKLGG